MFIGKKLIEDVHSFMPREGELAFWWLGQLGYIVKTCTAVLAFDPYLSARKGRRIPPVLEPEDMEGIDYVFGSHDHSDHIDHPSWPGIAKASPNARFIVPEMFAQPLAREFGFAPERIIGLDDGRAFHDERRGITIRGLAAAHEQLDPDPETGLHPSLSYIAETGDGLRIYHSGDTCKYEGLETALKGLAPFDLMFVPINGRDGTRYRSGCIGNMDFREAVDLVGAVRPRLAVPGHYEMFENNREDPMLFAEYLEAKYPERDFWIGGHGVRVMLRR